MKAILNVVPQVLKEVLGVIDKVVKDKDQAETYKQEVVKMHINGDFKEMEHRMAVIMLEAGSQDKYVSRARPTFLYMFYAYLALAFVLGFVAIWAPDAADQASDAIAKYISSISPEMWGAFTVGFLGYVWKRTEDKKAILGAKTNVLYDYMDSLRG